MDRLLALSFRALFILMAPLIGVFAGIIACVGATINVLAYGLFAPLRDGTPATLRVRVNLDNFRFAKEPVDG